jgi:TolA-binding protein
MSRLLARETCMRVLVAAFLTLVGLALLPWRPALAQAESREGIALQNQILELRQEVANLRDQLAHAPSAPQVGGSSLGGYQQPPAPVAPPADISTQLLDRVQRLEDEVRSLRGRIDEVDNARQRQGEDLAKQLSDLNFKLDNGAGAGGAPPSPPSGSRPAPTLSPPPGNLAAGGGTPDVPPPPPPPKRTPELILQEGNAALARHDYAAAEADARLVLAAGKGPRMTDAQFLLAQSLAARKDYSGAAVAFDDAYNRNRAGARAQDSLLGLASALVAIGEKQAACETLDKLRAEFPAPRADLRDPITAARRAAACH